MMTLLNYVEKYPTAESLEIFGIQGESSICERLQEMGLHKGLKIKLLGRAPLRGPLLIQFGTSFIALRAEEAACTLIQAP
jgi:Fe2+ transport system protein FeoA